MVAKQQTPSLVDLDNLHIVQHIDHQFLSEKMLVVFDTTSYLTSSDAKSDKGGETVHPAATIVTIPFLHVTW